MAHRSSSALKRAGELLDQGLKQQAAARLDAWHRVLSSLRRETAGLARDPDIERDLAMLEEYRGLLRGLLPDPAQRQHLAQPSQFGGIPWPQSGPFHQGVALRRR